MSWRGDATGWRGARGSRRRGGGWGGLAGRLDWSEVGSVKRGWGVAGLGRVELRTGWGVTKGRGADGVSMAGGGRGVAGEGCVCCGPIGLGDARGVWQ